MFKDVHWGQLLGVVVASTACAVVCHFLWQTTWLEVWAFVTGVVSLYFLAVERLEAWPVSLVSLVLYTVFFRKEHMYADMTLQVFYFVLTIHGWWSWAKGGSAHGVLAISRMRSLTWKWSTFVFVVLTSIYTPIVTHFGGAVPFVDSVLTSASMVTQYLQNRKLIENWLIWIGINATYIPLYLCRHYYPTALLYGLYLALAIVGWRQWRITITPRLVVPS